MFHNVSMCGHLPKYFGQMAEKTHVACHDNPTLGTRQPCRSKALGKLWACISGILFRIRASSWQVPTILPLTKPQGIGISRPPKKNKQVLCICLDDPLASLHPKVGNNLSGKSIWFVENILIQSNEESLPKDQNGFVSFPCENNTKATYTLSLNKQRNNNSIKRTNPPTNKQTGNSKQCKAPKARENEAMQSKGKAPHHKQTTKNLKI